MPRRLLQVIAGLLPGGAHDALALKFRHMLEYEIRFYSVGRSFRRDARLSTQNPRLIQSDGDVVSDAAPFAPNSADRRSAAACTIFARLCRAWMERRQIGPEMPSAPMVWPVKSFTGTATHRTSRLNSPSSNAMPLRLTSSISRSSA